MKITLKATLLLLGLSVWSTSNYAQKSIEIVGHRGAAFTAPENTLASVKKAVELGADAFEIDIHMSKDERLVVIHDSSTKRTTGEEYVVSSTEFSVLKTLDAGSFKSEEYRGEAIPCLEDILDYLPQGVNLYIEIKGPAELVPVLKNVLATYPHKKSQVRIIAFDLETISQVKELMPDVSCYYLKSLVTRFSHKKLIREVKKRKLDGVDLYFKTITPRLVRQLQREELLCLAWTVNSVEQARKLIEMGVVGITTDKPGLMKTEL